MQIVNKVPLASFVPQNFAQNLKLNPLTLNYTHHSDTDKFEITPIVNFRNLDIDLKLKAKSYCNWYLGNIKFDKTKIFEADCETKEIFTDDYMVIGDYVLVPPAAPEKQETRTVGVFLAKKNKDKSNTKTEPDFEKRISGFVHVEENLIDENGVHFLLCRTYSACSEKPCFIKIQNELLASKHDLIKEFMKYGVDFPIGYENEFFKYMRTVKKDQSTRVFASPGWHGHLFCLPDRTFYPRGFSTEKGKYFSANAADNVFSQQNTLKEWQENVSQFCADNSRLVLAQCMAYAAPLLKLCRVDSFAIELVGRSSIGKTTALDVANSICGRPKDLVIQARTTANGLEGLLAKRNSTLVTIDENGQIDPNEAKLLAYMLANGQGKQRSNINGDAITTKKWQLLALFTGEQAMQEIVKATGHKTRSGETVRLLTIQAEANEKLGLFDYLPKQFQDAGQFADFLKENCSKYYGTALSYWLQYLVENKEDIIEDANLEIKQYCDELSKDKKLTEIQKRVVKFFALLIFAGELATWRGITGWPQRSAFLGIKACFENWLLVAGAQKPEEKQLLSQFHLWIESSGKKMQPLKETQMQSHEIVGFVNNENNEIFYYATTNQFLKYICDGFDRDLAVKILKEANYLIPSTENRTTHSIRIPALDNKSHRVFKFCLLDSQKK